MTGPVGPVRSGLVRLGPVGLVRSVRCVYEDTRTGPIPRTNERTEQREANQRPHARTSARLVGLANASRLAVLILTNEFLIRDSAKESSGDRHLAVPSNGSLTAIGSCSVLRGAA